MIDFKSQIGQDMFVCEFFNYKRDGYFLDIGAFDGVEISNTYYLEKELGWSGICVEAGAVNWQNLFMNRDCKSVHAAISDRNAAVRFKEHWTVGKVGRTGDLTLSLTFSALISDLRVPSLIDYISIDIEGMEYRALTKFPFDTHEAILWTIETNPHEDGGKMKAQIQELMLSKGYNIHSEHDFETWWVNKKYDNRRYENSNRVL